MPTGWHLRPNIRSAGCAFNVINAFLATPGHMVEKVAISFEHHTGVRAAQTTCDREEVFIGLDDQQVRGCPEIKGRSYFL
mgnify:CR=1 FL=1